MSTVADFYGEKESLFNIIVQALGKAGSLENVTIDDLSPIDEFHIGGREATQDLLQQLNISKKHRVLDIGCGLGGPARFVASQYGCKVTGVDLTPEFISCGKELTKMTGLTEKVELLVGSALDLNSVLSTDNDVFESAFMLHVGMNIENKELLVSEISSKLRPGGLLGIYDVMRYGENYSQDLDFPVPWTNSREHNFAAPPEVYRNAIQQAGLKLITERNRFDFAIEFFSKMKEKKNKNPTELRMNLIMNEFPQKVENMLSNLQMSRISPFEMIAVKQ